MQKEKKSKRNSNDKLRNVLDNDYNNSICKDEKYLKSLSKRLDGATKSKIIYLKTTKNGENGKDADYLKPKVTIYPRKVKKIIEFPEIKEKKIEIVEDQSEVIATFEPKDNGFKDEEIFEIEKVKVHEPEFIEVKPKDIEKIEKFESFEEIKDEKIEEKKLQEFEEITEWEPVELKKDDLSEEKTIVKEKPKVSKNICNQCGAEFKEKLNFCPECGNSFKRKEKTVIADNICKQCGIKLDENINFCPECGNHLIIETKEQIQEITETEKITEKLPEFKSVVKEEDFSEIKPEIIKEQFVIKEDLIKQEEKIEAFIDMNSINDKTAILLYDNGYTTIESLKDVNIKELVKIKGLKRKTAKEIKKEVEKKIIEKAMVKPIVPGDTAEGEISKDQIIEEKIIEEKHTPTPVELSAKSSEWEPASEELINGQDLNQNEKIEIFKDIKCINDSLAIKLYDNGFFSKDDLIFSSVKELIKIKGINKKLAKEIKREVEQKSEWEPAKIEEEDIKEVDKKILDFEPEKTDKELFKVEEVEEYVSFDEECVDEFEDIKSIDTNIAKLLKNNGISSVNDLERKTIKDLTKIKGIKRKVAKQIKKEIKENLNKNKNIIKEELNSIESFNRDENPFINETKDEWESYDEDKIPDLKKFEITGYIHGDYTLYQKEIETKSGKKRIVQFFSKAEPEDAEPIDLPNDFEVKENKKTGIPYLKKKR